MRRRQRRTFKLPPRLYLPITSLIIMIILVAVVNQLTTLSKVSIVGASASNSEHIEKVAEDGLRRQWFGSSLLFVNAGGLRTYILKAEPIAGEVKIRRKFPHTLVVSVTERQPGIRWKSSEQVYLLDNKGTVIGESGVSHQQLPIVADSTNLPVKVGDRVVSQAFVTFCTALHNGLPAAGVKATELTIPESTSELHAKTDKGYIIKFDTTRPADGALTDLKNLQAYLTKNKKSPTEYIDLRISGKAYYR